MTAFQAGVEPWTISFKGALQIFSRLQQILVSNLPTECWCDALLHAIAPMPWEIVPIEWNRA